MTIQSAYLLRKLKKSQVHQDWSIQIDYDKLTVATYNQESKDTKVVNLSRYRHSLKSILKELSMHNYIDLGPFGHVSVTHTGWHAFGATVADAVKFTVRDVIVPVIVAVISSVITTLMMD